MDLPKAIEISEADLFHILTMQNYQPSYVKHVVALFLCLFHAIWVLGGGGGALKGSRAYLAHAVFQPRQLKNGIS